MNFSRKIDETIRLYEKAIDSFQLSAQEALQLARMKKKLQRSPGTFLRKKKKYISPILEKNEQKAVQTPLTKGKYSLDSDALAQFEKQGYLPPQPFPGFQQLEAKMIEELNAIYERKGTAQEGLMQHMHIYQPRLCQPFLEHIDFFVDQAASIFGAPRENLMIDTQIFSSRLPAPLHTDFPAEHFFDLTHLPKMLHFHMNLQTGGEDSGLRLFEGTHEEIIFPHYALRYLLENKVEVDIDRALKSIVISERSELKDVTSLSAKDTEHLLSLQDHEGRLVRIHDFNVGTYLSLLYFKEKHSATKGADTPVSYGRSLGECVTFNPSIIHYSDVAEETHGKPRFSMAVRVIEIPDARAFKMGPVFASKTFRWFFKTFVGTGMERLAGNCTTYEEFMSFLPHASVLLESEIKDILFGQQKVSPHTEINLAPVMCKDVLLPFISLDSILELNRRARYAYSSQMAIAS